MTPQKIKKRLQLCEFYTVIKRIALLRCHVCAPTNYTRLQKRWHATSVYNERWDSAKSYPNFPGRKRFIMRKDFPWIMREVNHWLCICANISHKGDGSCRSWIKLIRCQRFCNRVYLKNISLRLCHFKF